MLNYANLNDIEFEALCRDVMERKLGVSLRRFAPGRDGGVDLTDDANSKDIIVQVKHYRNSTIAQLISSLKKELAIVYALSPKQYYICCSRELSVENINDLYQHFQAYMDSSNQIITIIEIDQFLKMPQNRDILKKHFKLWLDDTGILQEMGNDKIFVDCEAFLDDVEDLHKLFVRTSAFDHALDAIKNEQTLCIIGDPGVGKSITSKMLVLYYASQQYRVRYTSNVSDLGTLKASLRDDPESKEIILLDDCFGQAYFEMKSTQSSELVSLIKYVKRRSNKVLILNSRVTIFQEAQRQRDLIQCLEREDFKVYILDINMLSQEEKAKILYNHLAFSDIPNEYFEDIKKEKRYWRIINHRNYNPRIIEFVCNPKRYRTVDANEFFYLFRKHLDNPREMWKDEYDDRLKHEDRILLQTIYSLTTTTVNVEAVRQCFERRISGITTIDKTVDQFNRALQRLNEGFIRILDNQGKREISMQNPSVNDFLDGRLLHEGAERTELLSSICMVNQLRLLPEKERISYIVNLLQTGKFDQFVFLTHWDRTEVIGHCILSSGLCIDKYRSELLDYLVNLRDSDFVRFSSLSSFLNVKKQILETKIWSFYDLKTFFEEEDHLFDFLHFGKFNNSVEFIRSIDNYYKGKNRISYVHQVEKYLADAVEECLNVDAADYEAYFDVEDAVRSATSSSPDGMDLDEDDAAAILDGYIQEEAFDDFERTISSLPEQFRYLVEHVQKDDFVVYGSDEFIQEYLSDPPGHYEYDDDRDYDEQHSYSPIDAIFER